MAFAASAWSYAFTDRKLLARRLASRRWRWDGNPIHEIQGRHWLAQARALELGDALAQEIIEEVIGLMDGVIRAASAQLPKSFPEDLARAIFAGIKTQTVKLARTSSPTTA